MLPPVQDCYAVGWDALINVFLVAAVAALALVAWRARRWLRRGLIETVVVVLAVLLIWTYTLPALPNCESAPASDPRQARAIR
jgi:hypothetical protein